MVNLLYLTNMKPKTNAEGLALVLTKISRPALARHLGLSRQLLHRWTEVPLKYVGGTAAATGLPKSHILPQTAKIFEEK